MSELTKDLSELVRRYNGTFAIVTHPGASFIRTYHATIQQNAEDAAKYRNDGSTHADGCYAWGPKHYECAMRKLHDDAEAAKRLRALERAMDTYFGDCIGNVSAGGEWIRQRADEILREGEPHDQD